MAESTRAALNALDLTVLDTQTLEVMETLIFDLTQRLASAVNATFARSHDEIFAELRLAPPPPLDASALSDAQLFCAFCHECCGTYRDATREWNASFSGHEAVVWLAWRVKNSDTFANTFETWVHEGWIEGVAPGTPVVTARPHLYILSERGLLVWDCGVEASKHLAVNGRLRAYRTPDAFAAMVRSPAYTATWIDTWEMLAGAVGSSATLKAPLEAEQLCSVVMQKCSAPLEAALELCAALVTHRYVCAVDEADLTSEPALFDMSASPSPRFVLRRDLYLHALNLRHGFLGGEPRGAVEASAHCYALVRDAWFVARQNSPVGGIKTMGTWKLFVTSTAELQVVRLDRLVVDDAAAALAARVAFWANCYNALYLHAWVERDRFDPPESAIRVAHYCIDGALYTLGDIRDGILLGDERVIGPSDPRYAHRVALAGDALLQLLLLTTESRVTAVAYTGTLAQHALDVATRTRELLLGNAELDADGSEWILPVETELVAQALAAQGRSPRALAAMLTPHFPPTWQSIAQRALEADGAAIRVTYSASRVTMLSWSDEDPTAQTPEAAVVGGGQSKDLWASGVVQKLNEAKASLVMVKTALVSSQREFERTLEEQEALKSAVERDEEETKKLEAELRALKDEHERVRKATEVMQAQVRENRTAALAAKAPATAACAALERLLAALQAPADDPLVAQVRALCTSGLRARVLVADVDDRALNAPKDTVSEVLKSRDPLAIVWDATVPHKEAQTEHARWLTTRCKLICPMLSGDDGTAAGTGAWFMDSLLCVCVFFCAAFLASITRVHEELAADESALERFFAKGLVECYARFFSTWKVRHRVVGFPSFV